MIELIVIAVMIVLDQFVKYLTVIKLKNQNPYVFINNVLQFRYAENTGAAFSLFENGRVFFIVFTFFIVCIAFYILKRIPKNRRFLLLRITMVVFIAGAIGNWIDRIRLGYVIDTFEVLFIDFAIFNVADIYMVLSTIAFAILMIFYYKEEELGFFKLRRYDNEKH